MEDNAKSDAAWAAIKLLRASRAATIATVADGQPFASFITPASAPDRSLLMLLSGLSPHTRHLRAEPRCSVMVMGTATSPNPQTAPRLSLSGTATPEPDPVLKARWVALHPYAAFYADLGDFQLWRFRGETGQFVGGFASAHRFGPTQLAADAAAVIALSAAETRVIEHCNDDHAEAMDAIAHAHGASGAGWRMVTCDVDGCDLAREETVVRVSWATPVTHPGAVRSELVRLAASARDPGRESGRAGPGPG
ncbi:MAG: HugZ family protein [Janthinobacterium lividum]